MRKISIEHLIERISKEEFEPYYKTHNTKDCAEYFDVTPLELKRLSEHFEVVKTRQDVSKIGRNTLEKVSEAYWNKSEDERKEISSKRSKTLLDKSEEEKVIASDKRRTTCQEKYGVDAPAQS